MNTTQIITLDLLVTIWHNKPLLTFGPSTNALATTRKPQRMIEINLRRNEGLDLVTEAENLPTIKSYNHGR